MGFVQVPQVKPRAYSYTRFSTPEQAKGKSLERQTEGADKWCKAKGVTLDKELTLHDMGVSAFRGKNSDTGALGVFLKAVHTGTVPKGSFLLIETFDRMSRESAYDAQLTLQNIINAGVTVVTLLDGKEYNVGILRADPIALIYAILLMSRSHEESSTKSKRISDAWRRKRSALKQGVKLTAVTPTWIKLDANRHFKVVPQRAKAIEVMFEQFIKGSGCVAIADHMNKKNIPTFKTAPFWHSAFISKCLRNRAVIGEFQPHREDTSGRTRKRIPDGDPIPNYYPAIIKPRIFEKVQLALRVTNRVPRVSPKLALRNMLAGLARCPHCEHLMGRNSKANNAWPRLACVRAQMGAGCKYKSVRLDVLENALVANAAKFVTQIPMPDDSLHARIAETEAALKNSQARIDDLSTLLDDTPSRVIAERIRIAEGECEKLRIELDALQTQLQFGSARRVKENATKMRDVLQWYGQAKEADSIQSVNDALRECFSQVVVDIDSRHMSMHWRHGGIAVVSY